MEMLVQNVRIGVRGLLHTPGFALIAVLTLGLGIGLSTAVFTVSTFSAFTDDQTEFVWFLDTDGDNTVDRRVVAVFQDGDIGVAVLGPGGPFLGTAVRTGADNTALQVTVPRDALGGAMSRAGISTAFTLRRIF